MGDVLAILASAMALGVLLVGISAGNAIFGPHLYRIPYGIFRASLRALLYAAKLWEIVFCARMRENQACGNVPKTFALGCVLKANC
jgi:hypothetical protein